tara:strand:+ start:84 stop:494 length:411 start_codon:yes stop_codon:yes gene_type:complete
MGNSDKFLLIVILLFTIFGLLFLIYKNPSFCLQKEGFEIDCTSCPSSCEEIETRKYDLCEQPWMYGVLDDSNITEKQRIGRLENLKKCYDTDCYEQCHNGPEAGVVNWDPGNTQRSRKYNEGKYYESVCQQKVIET